jgi:hypothetical protein
VTDTNSASHASGPLTRFLCEAVQLVAFRQARGPFLLGIKHPFGLSPKTHSVLALAIMLPPEQDNSCPHHPGSTPYHSRVPEYFAARMSADPCCRSYRRR